MIEIKFENGYWVLYFNKELKGMFDSINEAARASEQFRNTKKGQNIND